MLSPNDLLPHLEQLGKFGYWILLLTSGGESLPVVGLLVPGTVVVLIFGFFSAQGYLNIWWLLTFSTVGAIIGDTISYWLGKKGTHLFKAENRILKLSHLERGRDFFNKFGNKSIFFGRFLGPVRSIVPFVAGLSGMSTRRFFFWNVIGAVGWSGIYLTLGYFFGGLFQTIEVWSTRISVVFLVLVALVILIRFLAARAGKFFVFLSSLLKSISSAILTTPEVKDLMRRHPKVVHFMEFRLTLKRFSGLPLTVLVVAFMYIFSALFGVVESILRFGNLVAVDMRVNHLVALFRDPIFERLFLWITALGRTPVLVTAVITSAIIWWCWNKRAFIIGSLVSLVGTSIFIYLVKLVVARPRPLDAVYVESTNSFPSAHAALALAVYGFLAYGFIRFTKNWTWKVNQLFVAGTVIVLIGVSRIYLGVHYVSDVWSGYLLGALWLLVAISVSEWIEENFADHLRQVKLSSSTVTVVMAVVISLELVLVGLYATLYRPPLVETHQQVFAQTVNPPQALFSQQVPQFTQTIGGEERLPIHLLLLADDQAAVVRVFEQAGWSVAEAGSIKSFWKLTVAQLNHFEYAQAPMAPAFWNTQVQTIGFEQTVDGNVDQRHHVRVWSTPYETADGQQIFVATANQDAQVKWVVTHQINPNIDQERMYVLNSLTQVGAVKSESLIPFIDPKPSTGSEQPYFTDGQLEIIEL